MALPVGTAVWVKCDDGEWWPAKVRPITVEAAPFVGAEGDCCVEFYHDPAHLFIVRSSNSAEVQRMHVNPSERTAAEKSRFERSATRIAVDRALRDLAQAPPAPSPSPSPPPPPPLVESPSAQRPYSARELRVIQQLLGAVSGSAAAQLRQSLGTAGVDVSNQNLSAREAQERSARKRSRAATAPTAPVGPPPTKIRVAVAPALQGVSPPASSSGPSSYAPSSGHSSPPPESGASNSDRGGNSGHEEPTGSTFVRPVGARVLEVLRGEVFENPASFALSPVYRFIDVLGAVVVENCNTQTTLPTPRAVRVAPESGFAAERRVLLMALTPQYAHTEGWMQPIVLDGTRLSMRISIDGQACAVPANWPLTPGKEATAVRTAPVIDITDAVMRGEHDLFSLEVGFSAMPPDTELWEGIVACVFAEAVPLESIAEHIVSTYRRAPLPASRLSGRRSGRGRGAEEGLVNVTEGFVKVQCPLTTLPMESPVRSATCEHLQCMELMAVLVQCARSNLWNCPLCGASMRPSDMCVNYRLRDWISQNGAAMDRVEYIVETPPGEPLKVNYRHMPTHEEVLVLDD